MLALEPCLLLVLRSQQLLVELGCSLDIGISAMILVFVFHVPLLPASRQAAMVPPLIASVVMVPLLLRLFVLERLQRELHGILSVWSVPHWPVTMLRLRPVYIPWSLTTRLRLLMLRGREVRIRMSTWMRRVSGLLEPGR